MKRIYSLTLSLILICSFSNPLFSQLVPAFSSDATEGCAPLVINFKDESLGNPSSWRWDMGNGSVLFVQDPATTYLNPGTYTVKLIVDDGNGEDSIVKINYIRVYPKPKADFKASTISGCFPLPVKFSDLSTPESGTLDKWEWDFGDGYTSTEQNPEHIYTAIGNYNVVLRVTNSHGCTQTLPKLQYIKITTGAIADFTFSIPNNCNPPTIVNFRDSSNATGTVFYKWHFGDGDSSNSKNPTHTYTKIGTYPVTLTISNDFGCVNQVIKPNIINIGSVKADFTVPAQICAGKYFTPSNTSIPQPTGALWNFGNGDVSSDMQPSYAFPNPGNYTITLESNFGLCKDVTTKTIEVLDKPIIDFTSDKRRNCRSPLTVAFTVQTAETLTYQWNFGDGNTSTDKNPVHVYNSEDSFDVTLVATNSIGCTDTITKVGYIIVKRPNVTFDSIPDMNCLPFEVRPVAHIDAPETITSYRWEFGDGQVSTSNNPVYSYTTPGTHTIKLVYTTASGCTDSAFANTIQVGNKPSLNFSASPTFTCAFNPVRFTDLSTLPLVDKWRWEFGDGSISTRQNPTHNYTDTGIFDVKLVGWSSGCADSLILNDIVHIKGPIAKFQVFSICDTPFRKTFRDRSIDADEWFWEFGDGTTSTLQNPRHTYASNGVYIAKLTVRNDTCEHSFSHQVQVYAYTKDFTTPDTVVCTNVPVKFSASGIVDTDASTSPSLFWDFGDGNSQTGEVEIEHTYTLAGVYTVTLIVKDILGCIDTVIKPMYIKVEGPHAGFTTPTATVCANIPIVFNDTSSANPSQPIISWTWDYGDGIQETKNSGPFQHSYQQAGTFSVMLTVTDVNGCSSQAVQNSNFTISKPFSVFESQDIQSCTEKPIRFINSSTGNNNGYQWSFGDGQTSSAQQPTIQYSAEGAYDITLITTDINSCSDTLVKSSYINIRDPRALFTVSDTVSTCPPLVINFTNKSENFISYEWNFGDNTRPAPNDNPTHFYALPGTYLAKLKITSAGGCMDSMSQKLVVSGPEGFFTYDVVNGCQPLTIKFSGKTASDASFVWDFNDGSVEPGTSEITHTYTERGAYLPSMILVDPQGCRVPFPGADTLKVFGADANFTASTVVLCDSGIVNFTNLSTANEEIKDYRWKFSEGQESSLKDPTHFFRNKGQYPVELIVTTKSGCKDTLTSEVPIALAEKPKIDIVGDTLVCMPGNVQFRGLILGSDTSDLQWEWNFGNGATSSTKNPFPANYSDPKNYQVQVIAVNSLGCRDTAMKTVRPLPLPMVNAGEDKNINAGSSVQIITTHSPDVLTYNWKPGTELSCFNCKDPLATPAKTTTYSIEVKNQLGCTNKDEMTISVFCNEGNLFMPNTFSPNGDGINDVFYPRGKGLFSVKALRIFNRWGQIVFERHDFNPDTKIMGWNGQFNNRPASQDVYVYSIDIVCANNTILNYKGNVALIR